ncbi:MAG: ABC transporter substrate-binding protein [Lachnospiraceae bacterium]|nr:ABC transporter substrate-binding protein [Lachnospiraceae bacterium]
MKIRNIKRLSILVGTILSIGALTACGTAGTSYAAGNTGESNADNSGSAGYVAKEVNIGFVDTSGSGVLSDTLGVARDKGFFEEEFKELDVKVNFIPMTGAGPAINEALASGDLDIAEYGDVPLVNGQANGIDTKLISFAGLDNAGSLVSAPGTDYKSITDLKGKTIATQRGAFMHRVLTNILAAEGLSINDIEFVNANMQDSVVMLETGSVDAIIASNAKLSKLVNEGYNVVVDVVNEHPEFVASSGTAARRTFIEENPAIIKAYVRALIRAAKYEYDNPEIQIEQFKTSGESEEAFEYLFPQHKHYYSVAPVEGEVENFKDTLKFLIDNELLTADKEFNIDDWIDSSFYEEAFEELGDEYRVIYTDR